MLLYFLLPLFCNTVHPMAFEERHEARVARAARRLLSVAALPAGNQMRFPDERATQRDVILRVLLDQHWERLPTRGPDACEDPQDDPSAVFQTAPERICPPVETRGQELRKQIAVGGMDLIWLPPSWAALAIWLNPPTNRSS
jgi:hypothetical protein